MWRPFRRRHEPVAPAYPWPTYDMSRPAEPGADYCGSTAERLEHVTRTEIARLQAAADTARLDEHARVDAAAHDRRLRQVRDTARLRHTEMTTLEESRRHALAGDHDDELTALRRAAELEEAQHELALARRAREADLADRPAETGRDGQDDPQDGDDVPGAHTESEWTDTAIAAQLRGRARVPGIGAIAAEFNVGKGKAARAQRMAQDDRDAEQDGRDSGPQLRAVGE